MLSMCVSIDQRSIWEYFSTTFWFLKVGVVEGVVTPPLYHSCLLARHVTTKFCKVKIYEKYGLGSFIFGRFTTTACNLAANELLKI